MSKPVPNRKAGWHHNQEARRSELHRRLQQGRSIDPGQTAPDFGTNERTIRRDLNYLRDVKRHPLERQSDGTWKYTSKATDVPATVISNQDRFPLLIAMQFAEQFQGTGWHLRLQSLFTRLLETLHPELKTGWKLIAEKIRFEGVPQPQILPSLWDVLYICLEASQTIQLRYQSANSNRSSQRLIDPYGLVIRNREFYLVGWDHSHNEIRTFYLPRVLAAETTDQDFSLKDGFNLDEYLATSIDALQSNADPVEIKLRFSPDASTAAKDYIWSRRQQQSEDGKGRLIVSFHTRAIFAVERHILSWGGNVEVLAPASLRKDVRAAALRIAQINNFEP